VRTPHEMSFNTAPANNWLMALAQVLRVDCDILAHLRRQAPVLRDPAPKIVHGKPYHRRKIQKSYDVEVRGSEPTRTCTPTK